MTVKLGGSAGSVNLTQKMMKGDDGGYYYPFVDENSNLSWVASESDMAAPPQPVNIAGPAGEKGEPGVYVGSEEPAEDVLIWLDPQGEASDNLATKEYVDEAIANIDIPEPEVDLSNYALKTEIPDVSGYQTAAQVQTLIDNSLATIGVAEDGEY
jgi:hypothetical protein